MNQLGIYFGPKIISIAEAKAKALANHLAIPQSLFSANELEESVPPEVKIVATFKDELRKNNIVGDEAVLALAGKDLVIRTFEMPVMPPKELALAVRFEAKKYIPFKIEDLVSDFQVQFDKVNRKNYILFVGIKREVMDRYLSLLKDIDIKLQSIEYSAFSVLRFLKICAVSDKGLVGTISLDLKEEDEVNFLVLKDGFPLFSRDITLREGPEELLGAQQADPGMILEKIKTEIRISLDYYNRKFPLQKMENLFFISAEDYRADLEAFTRDLGLPAQFVEVAKAIDSSIPFSSNLIKAYSASLFKAVKAGLKINLLTALQKEGQKEAMAKSVATAAALPITFKPYYQPVAIALLACILTFIFGTYRALPLKKEIKRLTAQRQVVANIQSDTPYEQLSNLKSEYQQKVESIDNLIKGQVYVAKLLEIISRVKPEGVWLGDFNFRKQKESAMLTLNGMAYIEAEEGKENREIELINKFIADLKGEALFGKYFPEINIVSLDQNEFQKERVSSFTVSCRSQPQVGRQRK